MTHSSCFKNPRQQPHPLSISSYMIHHLFIHDSFLGLARCSNDIPRLDENTCAVISIHSLQKEQEDSGLPWESLE